MHPWQEGGDQVIMVMEENNLQLNTYYSGVITVSTDVGQSSTVFKFGMYVCISAATQILTEVTVTNTMFGSSEGPHKSFQERTQC